MKRISLAILSGALLGAPFLVPVLWPLILVGIVPLLFALEGPVRARYAFGLGSIAGLALYGEALFAIFWTVLPLDWLGVFTPAFQLVIVCVSWAVTAAGFALWTGVFALTYTRLRSDRWTDVLLVASLWTLAEWAGAWWFGIQNAGPGSIFGPHFTLAFIGNALAHDVALVQVAWLGGVYALSFLCALSGALLHWAARPRGRVRVSICILLALVLAWGTGEVGMRYVPAYSGNERVTIAAVSTQRPAVFQISPAQEAAQASTTLDELQATRGAAVVALPEGTDLLRILNAPKPARGEALLQELYAGTTTPAFIDSGTAYSSHATLRSRITLYDVGSGTYAYQDKQFLLPDGEYVPWYVQAWVSVAGQSASLTAVSGERGLTSGADARPLTAAATTLSVLFCDEAMSPELYRLHTYVAQRTLCNGATLPQDVTTVH